MRTYKRVLLGLGLAAVVVALSLFAVGGPLVNAHATQRDSAGYYTGSAERLTTPTYALVSSELDVVKGGRGGNWDRVVEAIGTLRLGTHEFAGRSVFIGIASTADVTTYLADTPYDTVSDLSRTNPVYQPHSGTAAPAAPTSSQIWVASASGPDNSTLTWKVTSGDWTIVVMNTDPTKGVDVRVTPGIRTGALLPLGLGLVGAGLVAALLGAGLLALAVAGLTHQPVEWAHPHPEAAVFNTRSYPVRVDARLDPEPNRWLWLVKWFLVIPHVIVLAFLWLAFGVLTVVAGVSILFTRRYPRGIFAFNVGVLRWHWRVVFYALTLGTDRYPPFTLGAVSDYPATLSVPYPTQLSRPLVLVKWWLLALPHYLIVAVFGGTTWWAANSGNHGISDNIGLVGLLALVAGVMLTVTGRYPRPVFDFILGMQRWTLRVATYAALMRDEYPPFRLDAGGTDPGSQPVAPPSLPTDDDALARV